MKAYFALKICGDDVDAPHMARAREAILAHGGGQGTNVFTRIQLALFGEVPWRAVPVMPVEIMLLPRWFPFHLDKVSYWSRTVIVPLLVLMALKPRRAIRAASTCRELFVEPPEQVRQLVQHEPQGRLGQSSSAASIACCAASSRCSRRTPRERCIDEGGRLGRPSG